MPKYARKRFVIEITASEDYADKSLARYLQFWLREAAKRSGDLTDYPTTLRVKQFSRVVSGMKTQCSLRAEIAEKGE